MHASTRIPPQPIFANSPQSLGASNATRLPEKLESEIRLIYERSPIYERRFSLHSEPLQWSCYSEIPTLSKQEIVERGHDAFFSDYSLIERGLEAKRYEYESTSGTTAGPMTVIMESGWWNAQTLRAYRAHPLLAPFAERSHRKCILAPVNCSSNLCPYEDHPFPHRYCDGTVYLNLTSDPFVFPEAEWDRILLEIQAVRPDILEGEPIYLSLLARAAVRRNIRLTGISVVILTYGKASLVHSQRIAEAFPAPQVDLYGSTEAGYLFIGDAFQGNSKVIEENGFVELVPYRDSEDIFQILVTTRERVSMPLLKYHTGDIVKRLSTGYRLLGRERDIHESRNGDILSAFEIDSVIPSDFLCWHYTLVQTAESRWDFHYVADSIAPRELSANIAKALGGEARVNAFRRRLIAPATSGKFTLLKPIRRP